MPRKPRAREIDLNQSRVYHVMSRCVRGMSLLACDQDGVDVAKPICLRVLAGLVDATAVDLVGFAIMDQQVHLLLHVDLERAEAWSAREVAQRWVRLHPARDGQYRPIDAPEGFVESLETDASWVASTREKLASISQFMKEFKQIVAHELSKHTGVGGAFWEGRYKIRAVVGDDQLLAALSYIDLQPLIAGVADTPAKSRYTSAWLRLREARGVAVRRGAAANKDATPRTPKLLRIPARRPTSRGLFPGLTLDRYRELLKTTARLIRPGQRRPSSARHTVPIHSRTTLTPQDLVAELHKLAASWERNAPGVTALSTGGFNA